MGAPEGETAAGAGAGDIGLKLFELSPVCPYRRVRSFRIPVSVLFSEKREFAKGRFKNAKGRDVVSDMACRSPIE